MLRFDLLRAHTRPGGQLEKKIATYADGEGSDVRARLLGEGLPDSRPFSLNWPPAKEDLAGWSASGGGARGRGGRRRLGR